MHSAEIQKIIQAHKETFTGQYGIEKLFLYGSYATNSQNENSDLDLMYVMRKDTGMSPALRDL